jgi:hypothetical protein
MKEENLIAGTNTPGVLQTTIFSPTPNVSGDLSGTFYGEVQNITLDWDGPGEQKGCIFGRTRFDDEAGNTFNAFFVGDFDTIASPSQSQTHVTGYMVSILGSGTGNFTGQVLIGTRSDTSTYDPVTGNLTSTGTLTLRRYASSEVSGPYSGTATGTSTPGSDPRAFGPSTGPNPDDEFIQFREDNGNITIPQGDPALYLWGTISASATGVAGAPTGNVTRTFNNIIIPGNDTTPTRGLAVVKGTLSTASGNVTLLTVTDMEGSSPGSIIGYNYTFALRENNTGAYADKDIYSTATTTSSETDPYFTADTEWYILTPSAPTPTPTPTPAPTVVVETPSGGNITVSTPNTVVTFDTVLSGGNTTVTTTSENPVGPTPSGFNVAGLFVDITTTANYTGNVTVGISYDPSTPNAQNLRLFHYEGGDWVDVTTWVDTSNHIIYGEVSSLSWFFIGGQWVWVETAPVPVFPSVYIGIAAALGAGALAYYVRRRLIQQG